MDKSPRVRKATDLGREELETAAQRCDGDLEAMVDDLEVSKNALRIRMKELGMR